MKITNKLGLPNAAVCAVETAYKPAPNEYRVTSLLKGVREIILERRHGDQCECDVSDMSYILLGLGLHALMEQQPKKDTELREVRFKTEISGRVISGQIDRFDEGELVDYKTSSIWKYMFKDYEDWRKQLLIYSYLLKLHGYEVTRAKIVDFFKDQQKSKAKYNSDYPAHGAFICEFTFNDKDYEQIVCWLSEKIELLKLCEDLPDNELPICTPKERFNRDAGYAVMKKGRKTALRVLPTKEAAEQWQADNGGNYIEYRPGKDVKCEDYCIVKDYCNYYNEVVKK